MMLDDQLTRAAHEIADRVRIPDIDLAAVRSRARANRRRDVSIAVGAALVAITVVGSTLVGGQDSARPLPAEPPNPTPPPHVAVWYDQEGLHHGDEVDPTAVDLSPGGPNGNGRILTLVRGGALYSDPASDEVWFHPWDGKPHVIGHSSRAGPRGDPQGDYAAWFEGSELIVYDTLLHEEVSRTRETPASDSSLTEHLRGTGFMHVSTDEVVWRSASAVHRLDLATGESTRIDSPASPEIYDLHDGVRVLRSPDRPARNVIVETASGPPRELSGVETGRLSHDGSFLLGPAYTSGEGSHGAAIIDTRSGDRWDLLVDERPYYGWISWSYDDIALVAVDQPSAQEGDPKRTLLLACEAITQECERLATYWGGFVLPAV